MIVIELNGEQYKYPEFMREVTLGEYIEYQNKIGVEQPDSLNEFEGLGSKEERDKFLSDLENVGDEMELWLDWQLRFVSYWTKIDDELLGELEKQGKGNVLGLYGVIRAGLNNISREFKFEQINHDGEVYHFPKFAENPFDGKLDFMKGSRTIDIITSYQYEKYKDAFGSGELSVLPALIAILCKKEGEELPLNSSKREEWIKERSKVFESLNLEDAMEVGFFLGSRKNDLRNYAHTSSLERE